MIRARRVRRSNLPGALPPAEVLPPDGRVPHANPLAERWLAWLQTTHPEIDYMDASFGWLTDPAWDRLAVPPEGPTAAQVVAHYCDPAAHPETPTF